MATDSQRHAPRHLGAFCSRGDTCVPENQRTRDASSVQKKMGRTCFWSQNRRTPLQVVLDSTSNLTRRPSGTPEQVMHVILDCPTSKNGTFSHPSAPPLDSANKSASLLLQKGFRTHNCFVFDAFPRRINIPTVLKRNAFEIWPEFANCYDKLHSQYRAKGGLVTLIVGGNAEKAYNAIIRREHAVKEAIFRSANFDVWAERSRFVCAFCPLEADL
jgi:hypothetical protein